MPRENNPTVTMYSDRAEKAHRQGRLHPPFVRHPAQAWLISFKKRLIFLIRQARTDFDRSVDKEPKLGVGACTICGYNGREGRACGDGLGGHVELASGADTIESVPLGPDLSGAVHRDRDHDRWAHKDMADRLRVEPLVLWVVAVVAICLDTQQSSVAKTDPNKRAVEGKRAHGYLRLAQQHAGEEKKGSYPLR